jgi:hypothetical protein
MELEVKEYFESLHLHKKHVMAAGLIVGGIPDERLFNHDASKFTIDEYPYYARQFHGDRGDPVGFARAWLHHIHCNDHHWNHWLFADGYSPYGSGVELSGALPMPEVCVREMVADWMGASRTYTDSWNMEEWLNEHLPQKIILHSESFLIVGQVLRDIGYVNTGGEWVLIDMSRY